MVERSDHVPARRKRAKRASERPDSVTDPRVPSLSFGSSPVTGSQPEEPETDADDDAYGPL